MRRKVLILTAALGACSHAAATTREPATASSRAVAEQRIRTIAARKVVDPLAGYKVPKDRGEALVLARALEYGSGNETDANRAFRLAASTSDLAAPALDLLLGPDSPPDVLAAAATGLGFSKSPTAENALIGIALRPSHPPEAIEALFSYYRFRGEDKPIDARVEDDVVRAYRNHPQPRGRAALCHLGRIVKDQLLTDVAIELSGDADVEVRRAATMALADGPEKKRREGKDRERCLAQLAVAVKGREPRVVIAALRALGTYAPLSPAEVQTVLGLTTHGDFNVRVQALRALGATGNRMPPEVRTGIADALTKLARSDGSVSVRHEAGAQLVAIDPVAAQALADDLLKDPNEYVRCAGCIVLAKSTDPKALERLAQIARTDAHVRVRETALSGFEEKADAAVAKEAVQTAFADRDPVLVATACGVAAKNKWKDLVPAIEALPARFPGCAGADAREGAIAAVADLDAAGQRAWFQPFLADPNPAVRLAAERAVATADGKTPPQQQSRGADLTGELLPGGAPVFGAEPLLVVETSKGTMKIRLYPDQAPVHCAHVAALAKNGFYDGLDWHRVEPDFVIQGGCPRGDGSGNAGVTLPLESTSIPFERGTLGMPRAEHYDTGGCQLFICHSRSPHLDVRYTAFGRVVEGLDVIDRIDVDDRIVRVRVEGVR